MSMRETDKRYEVSKGSNGQLSRVFLSKFLFIFFSLKNKRNLPKYSLDKAITCSDPVEK